MEVSYKYSPSTGAFYPSDINYQTVPDDLIQVQPGGFQTAMSRSANQKFSVSPEGEVTVSQIETAPQVEVDLAIFKNEVEVQLRAAREHALSYFMIGEPFPAEWVVYVKQLNALKEATVPEEIPSAPSV